MESYLLEEITEGVKEAKRGNTRLAMEMLQGITNNKELPSGRAWLGYCIAQEKKAYGEGIRICRAAIAENPRLGDSYLALARIFLSLGHEKKAVEVLQEGYKWTQNHEIERCMNNIGVRRRPIFPFLDRKNILNIMLGRSLAKIGLR